VVDHRQGDAGEHRLDEFDLLVFRPDHLALEFGLQPHEAGPPPMVELVDREIGFADVERKLCLDHRLDRGADIFGLFRVMVDLSRERLLHKWHRSSPYRSKKPGVVPIPVEIEGAAQPTPRGFSGRLPEALHRGRSRASATPSARRRTSTAAHRIQRGASPGRAAHPAERGDQLGQDARVGNGFDRREVVVRQVAELGARERDQLRAPARASHGPGRQARAACGQSRNRGLESRGAIGASAPGRQTRRRLCRWRRQR